MVFDWLKPGRGHAGTIAQLKEQLKKKRGDPRLKLQLAEVLLQAKRPQEAAPLLEAVADDFALQGMGARAIAVLKRLQALKPGDTDVEEKLAYLISQQENPAAGPWRQKAEERRAAVEIGIEEITDGFESPAASATPGGLDLADEGVRHELLALLDMAFAPDAAAPEPAVAPTLAASPLLSAFRPDELVAIMRDLKLHVFEAGEILVTQGEPGESLFILASGRARAYVREAGGRSRLTREMKEGDFFGEIALMTGMPRTATVTAATRCELLELDRQAVARLTQAQPRIREVLQEFYAKHMSGGTD